MYKISYKLVFQLVFILIFNITTSFGQNDIYATKIKDGSITNSSTTAAPSSLLELESSSKGFLLPRMTTTERNNISISDKERGNGLVIYNKDTDCINYWSTANNRWLNLCGTLPPAIVDIQDCSKIFLNATGSKELTQGKYLKESDILYVSLNVLEPGSYNISAMTSNGYSFSSTGNFNTSGIYTIALEGMGTPLAANEVNGDLVTFNINGKVSNTCSVFRIKVKPSNLNFTIVSPQNIDVSWDAFIGVPLNAHDNKVTLKVNVTSVGLWSVQSTSTINGISFNGSGEFTEEGLQEIEIIGQGIPVVATLPNAPNIFKLSTNSISANKPDNVTIKVAVAAVSFELICSDPLNKIEIHGVFKEDTKLTKNNTIIVPVKVLAPGNTEVILKGEFIIGSSSTEVMFRNKNVNLVFNASRSNIQYITLYADEVLIPKGTTEIRINTISPGDLVVCTDFPKIAVKEQLLRYTIMCNSVRVNGDFLVDTAFGDTQYIELKVNVDYPGSYVISTNSINGVSFSAEGNFVGQGLEAIKLKPVGTFTEGGDFSYTITTNSFSGVTECSTNVNVKFRDIVILCLGSSNYGPSTSSTYAGGAILNSKRNFGSKGLVKVNNVKILNTGYQGAALRNYIKSNKVDIIFNVIGYNANTETTQVFLDFVQKDKGVLVISDENTVTTSTKTFIDKLASSSLSASANFTMLNPVLNSSSSDKIINGVFGDLTSKYIGNDATNGWYYSNLSSSLIPLISKQGDSNWTWGLKHKDLGFAFFGDGGWIVGTPTNTNTNVWPSRYLTNGTPIAKPYWQGTNVYNSVLYANLLAWAIDYVKVNKPVN